MPTESSSVGSAELASIDEALNSLPDLFRAAQAAIFPGTTRQVPVSGPTTSDATRRADRLWNARHGLTGSGERAAPARVATLQVVMDVERRLVELRTTVEAWASRPARVSRTVTPIAAAQRVDETCGWLRAHADVIPVAQLAWVVERLRDDVHQLAVAADPEPEVTKFPGVCPDCHCRSLVTVRMGIDRKVVCQMDECNASWAWTRGAS